MELRGCIALLLFGILESTMNETLATLSTVVSSQQHTQDAIRENISSVAESLKTHVNDRLTVYDNIQSNLSAKIRSLENSLTNLEKNCANSSNDSKLDENLRNLERSKKNEWQSFNSEILQRVKQLEERAVLREDAMELNKTLRNHSSEITGLHLQLLDIQNSCDYPPRIANGYPVIGNKRHPDRNHGAIVTYACRENSTLVDRGQVVCRFGEWVGVLPECLHGRFDATFTLQYNFYVPNNFTCYSDDNYDNLQFSRVLDTGKGKHMPSSLNYSKNPVEKYARIQLRDNGAFQCKYDTEHGFGKIVSLSPYRSEINPLNSYHVASVGDTVELRAAIGRIFNLTITWKHNGVDVRTWDKKLNVTIPNVKPSDAGIYECFYEGRWEEYHALMRLIVRKCRADLYGKDCDHICPICYNGGICHDEWGRCICPAGFTGPNCEIACGEGRFGAYCRKSCERYGKVDCNKNLFCKPDPFGCSCAPGFKGLFCSDRCYQGWYGADCKQPCHCARGPASCNRFTGACDGGCSRGWTGDSCQIKDIN